MTGITVLSWNMAMGYGEGCSWDRLEDLMHRYRADVALLNEVRTDVLRTIPQALFEPWGTRGLDRKHRDWGTAIVSRHPVTEIGDAQAMSYDGRRPNVRFENSRPGSWIAGLLEVPGEDPVTCVSIYGLMDQLSDASVHRSLSDMSALFSDERYRGRLVLGGDLNITTQYPKGPRLDACVAALARICAFGLTDLLKEQWQPTAEECRCTFGPDCRHTRTRVDPNDPDNPLQVDYLFASKKMLLSPYSCITLDPKEWVDCSDHAPILATFGQESSEAPVTLDQDVRQYPNPWIIQVRGHPARRDSISWREAIRAAVLKAYPEAPFPPPPAQTKFTVDVVFRMTREDLARPAFDLDNFAKPILDTLFTSQNVTKLSGMLLPHVNDTWVFRLLLEKVQVATTSEQGADITITWHEPGTPDLSTLR